MATVKIIEPRAQAAHFGLYKTSVGGDEAIIVRRKVADPTDYMHTTSKKLKRVRTNLALASKHYASLTPSQKAITRHQAEFVDIIKSHGKSDTKLLIGRQLFIAKTIKSLFINQKLLPLPLELCIMLVDPDKNPIIGELWLHYLTIEGWLDCTKQEIDTGHWLFSTVPPDQARYHPYGEAAGYLDFQDPITTLLDQQQLKAYHYHILHPAQLALKYIGRHIYGPTLLEGHRRAQTFELDSPETIIGVTILATRGGDLPIATLHVNIEDTTAGVPNGSILSQGQLNLEHIPTYYQELPVPLSPAPLQPLHQYALVYSVLDIQPPLWWNHFMAHLLWEDDAYLPQIALHSHYPSGTDWHPNTRGRSHYTKLWALPD